MTGMVLDGAGWFGGIAVATAYVLLATRRLTADARLFQVLNIIGGVLLTATTLYRHAVPNTVINVVWIVFGVYGLATARRRRRRARLAPPVAPLDDDAEPYPVSTNAIPELAEAR
ncbi:MAG: hypothetical protein GEV10_29255 [Streptosporangiales bacterium]|nr:hypothetical protein [Streptosporangiales bacterium]